MTGGRDLDAGEVIRLLGLEPLPVEGGYYRETYRLPAPGGGERAAATAIYYLLTPDTFSELHRLPSDEIYHFYLGDPVDLLVLEADGSVANVALGADLRSGMTPQVTVPGGAWQGSRLRDGGRFALLGTTMTPGFSFAAYESGRRDDLAARYPAALDAITRLTRH